MDNALKKTELINKEFRGGTLKILGLVIARRVSCIFVEYYI